MIAQGYHINAEETDGTWLDGNLPAGYLSLNDAVLRQIQASSSGTIEAGVIVGNYSQIQSLKLISGKLPDRSLVF